MSQWVRTLMLSLGYCLCEFACPQGFPLGTPAYLSLSKNMLRGKLSHL